MRRVFLAVALLLTALPAFAAPFPATVVDGRGVAVTERAAPRRIISLTPATTEMLFALGLGPRVVGDTPYCDTPPAAKRVPKIGDAMTLNLEKIAALHPDLIVGDAVASSSALSRLRGSRWPVFAVKPDTLAAIENSLRQLGAVTGAQGQAAHLIRGMEAKRRAAARLALRPPARPRVLIVVGTAPLWVAGQATFLNDLLAQAGGVNAVSLSGYAAYSKELALARPPDVILASPADQAALRKDPILGRLPAVRQGRFIFVTDAALIERPGPRAADGLLQLARALHPGAH